MELLLHVGFDRLARIELRLTSIGIRVWLSPLGRRGRCFSLLCLPASMPPDKAISYHRYNNDAEGNADTNGDFRARRETLARRIWRS